MLTIKIHVSTNDAAAACDPEGIVRNVISALARYEAHVPAIEERVIRDDNGNRIGSILITNEAEG